MLSSPFHAMEMRFRSGRQWRVAFGAALVLLGGTGPAIAGPREIALPGSQAFPENITSTSDGTIYVGSVADGGVVRVLPGHAAQKWIKPGAFGSASTFGLLADEASHTLWVCSGDLSAMGIRNPGTGTGSALVGFDLATGKGRVNAALVGPKASCNDIAVGRDGAAYVTNFGMGEIWRLRPGTATFDVWLSDPVGLAAVDGIAFGGDGNLYVTTFRDGGLHRIDVKPDGSAGAVTRLRPSRPLEKPDGMRPLGGNRFAMIEGAGRVDRLTVNGDQVAVETLLDGLSGPTGVTVTRNIAWAAEGQLAFLFDPAKRGKQHLPFRVVGVRLAGR